MVKDFVKNVLLKKENIHSVKNIKKFVLIVKKYKLKLLLMNNFKNNKKFLINKKLIILKKIKNCNKKLTKKSNKIKIFKIYIINKYKF